MEDKEERILVLQGTGEYLCNKLNDDIPCENKYNCLECKLGLSRSEAIEKIAKSICRTYGEDCETCRFIGNEKGCKRYLEFQNYIAMAEAALNELLDGHDDER